MSLVPYAGRFGSSLPQPVPMLTGDNYTTWAIKVEANLDAVGLWEAVVPTEDAAVDVIAKKDKPSGIKLPVTRYPIGNLQSVLTLTLLL
ncbi:retrotransposon protein [Hordeum vulgare]|nr:retrotransposon protein [Hordeum vulgare]